MKINTPVLTLPELIKARMRECNISRSQLVQRIGYKNNINKGIKRLDFYLQTIQPPSELFVINLLNILEISGSSYLKAFLISQKIIDKADAETRASEAKDRAEKLAEREKSFSPYIEVPEITPSPAEFYLKDGSCGHKYLSVPLHIQSLPFNEELSAVVAIYRKNNDKFFPDKIITKFIYYRGYNYFMEFTDDAVLKKIEFSTTFNKSSFVSDDHMSHSCW